MNKAQLHNFAYDNTISAEEINSNELIKTLGEETKIAIEWFKANEMIEDPDKFSSNCSKKKSSNVERIPIKHNE